VALETKHPVHSRGDRSVGNIYERLDAARRQREQVLETPAPANDDRRAQNKQLPHARTFPKLKPPKTDLPKDTVVRRWDWIAPWLVGAAIFVLIFGFAVR